MIPKQKTVSLFGLFFCGIRHSSKHFSRELKMATTAGGSAAKRLGRLPFKNEPNWIIGDLKYHPGDKLEPRFPAMVAPRDGIEMEEGPVQQSDLLKPLWMDIAKYGLNFAYQKRETTDIPVPYSKTVKPKKVIVVGAGMAGLVAAYELEQVGHDVVLLESQTRVGGRVHTLGEKDGFAKDLHGEAGAMRLPCSKEAKNKTHFLTDFYAAQRFKLPLAPFDNYSENAYLKFYNDDRVRIKDWDNKNFDKLWPGWKKTLEDTGVQDVNTIDEYFSRTTEVLTNQLRVLLCQMEPCKAWEKWIDIWSQFPLDGFLQSSYEAVMTKVKAKVTTVPLDCLEQLKKYLPWPEAAITAYSVFNYTQQLDQSLVQYLREQLGQWWSSDMHRIQGGMSLLPEAFTKKNDKGWDKEVHLYRKIQFNSTVKEILYTFDANDTAKNHVVIKGYFTNSRQPFHLEGDAVIVATPVNILRQFRFLPNPDGVTPPPPVEFQTAFEDIFTGAATKIFVQTRTRFWEDDGIKGGFSKTDLPIGQIHYPSKCDGQHPGEKGILLIYTWKTEALLFGSLDPTTAVHEVVEQVATIHPEIKDQFETGAVFAWYNQPTAQGAYALLKPNQYQNVKWLFKPMCNIFFAGEGLSFAAGWIQGALESGLRAAYQFYIRNEGGSSNLQKSET